MSLNTIKALLILNMWSPESRAAAKRARLIAKKSGSAADLDAYARTVAHRITDVAGISKYKERADRLYKLQEAVAHKRNRARNKGRSIMDIAAEVEGKSKAYQNRFGGSSQQSNPIHPKVKPAAGNRRKKK